MNACLESIFNMTATVRLDLMRIYLDQILFQTCSVLSLNISTNQHKRCEFHETTKAIIYTKLLKAYLYEKKTSSQ